jgi:thiamine biosynthesis lipoprotein
VTALQDKFFALGSDAILTLVPNPGSNMTLLLSQLKTTILSFEQRFTRFTSTSELTAVNHQAGTDTKISPEFSALLATALDWAKRTGGLYNPLILPALQSAGYVGSWPRPAKRTASTDYTNRRMTTPNRIKLTGTQLKIPSDSALDFGGIGKGYLLDQLAEITKLFDAQLAGFWFSLGGDIIARGLSPDSKPWSIGIARAASPDELAGQFVAADGAPIFAVATSGVTKRQGTNHQGQSWHHLIDPRTGAPAKTDLLTVSVRAVSATAAGILAKCAVILGSSEAQRFLRAHSVPEALMQLADAGRSLHYLTNEE